MPDATAIAALLLSCSLAAAHRVPHSNVCKWCDNSQPVCRGPVCFTNCSLSSYCESDQEICVTVWKQENGSVRVTSLCHHPLLPLENILVPNYNSAHCVMAAMPSVSGRLYVCGCRGEQDCNDQLLFYNTSHGFSMQHSRESLPAAAISLLPPLLLAVTIAVLFYVYRTHRLRGRSKPWPEKAGLSSAPPLQSGLNPEPLCVTLEQRVGGGRYAEVWRARLRHETVAVKIFPRREFASWRNESRIFSHADLKHANVLRFIAAEEERGGGAYRIITEYHPRGNLKDHLSNHVLSWAAMLKMAGSIVRGVAHLHSDRAPCGAAKVAVAHRDIKSANVLVKNDGECALCDFGIALRLDPALSADDFANSGQVGTARYMAPEVLESRVNLEDLESFKQMDVYSLALVLWEAASRCDAIGEVRSYELPFGSMVQQRPCVETMRDLVLHSRGRPPVPQSWRRHPGLDILCDTITECWDHDPEARLTAHCVLERFRAMEEAGPESSPVVGGGRTCGPSVRSMNS
ncbi:TGF-beta receptor type-2-like [Gastrophryne carolinensis]